LAAKLTAPWQPIQLLNNAGCVRCSGWSNDVITWGNPIRYADSVQTNTNSNRISRLLTLDPVRIQCVRLHDRAIRSRGSDKLESVCTWPNSTTTTTTTHSLIPKGGWIQERGRQEDTH